MNIDFAPILTNAQHLDIFSDWALTTAHVAEGFGCTAEAVRSHKTRNASELIEHKHWIKRQDADNIARIYWSRRGIVRLGFLIESDRAKAFRDAAEDYLLETRAPSMRCILQRAAIAVIGIVILAPIAIVYLLCFLPFQLGEKS